MGGSLLGGIAVPLTLTAQSAYEAPDKANEKASPNLPLKAQLALLSNGSWEHVGAESCRVVITPNGAIICV